MELEKDNFEDDNELSRLEADEELGGGDLVETEEEEIAIVSEEPEESAPRPAAARPAPKKKAKKRPAKKAKKAGKKRPAKKAAKKKTSKKKKRR
jgi:hypothetical protein